MWAVINGHIEIVKLLLQHYTSIGKQTLINVTDIYGNTALFCGVYMNNSNSKITELLLQYGADKKNLVISNNEIGELNKPKRILKFIYNYKEIPYNIYL